MDSVASTSAALGRLSLETRLETHLKELPTELLCQIFEHLTGSDMHALQTAFPGLLDTELLGFCRRKRTTLRLPEDVPFARDVPEFFAHFGQAEEETRMAEWLARFFGHVRRVSIRGNWNAWFFTVIDRLYANELGEIEQYKRWILRVKDPGRQTKLEENLATVGGWKLLVSVQGDFPLVEELDMACPQGSFYPRWTTGKEEPAMDIVRDAERWRLRRVIYRPSPDNDPRYVDLRPLVETCDELREVTVLPDPADGFPNPEFPLR